MRSPPRREKREEHNSALLLCLPRKERNAPCRSERTERMVPRRELKDAESMERRGKHHAPFYHSLNDLQANQADTGLEKRMAQSGISARGFAPAPESGENAKTGRMSPNDSPAPGPSGSISLREAAAQKGLSRIMRSDIPALSGLIRPFLCPEEPPAKGPEGTAPRSLWVCAAVLNSQST